MTPNYTSSIYWFVLTLLPATRYIPLKLFEQSFNESCYPIELFCWAILLCLNAHIKMDFLSSKCSRVSESKLQTFEYDRQLLFFYGLSVLNWQLRNWKVCLIYSLWPSLFFNAFWQRLSLTLTTLTFFRFIINAQRGDITSEIKYKIIILSSIGQHLQRGGAFMPVRPTATTHNSQRRARLTRNIK